MAIGIGTLVAVGAGLYLALSGKPAIPRWGGSDRERLAALVRGKHLVLQSKTETPFTAVYALAAAPSGQSGPAETLINNAAGGLRLHVLCDAAGAGWVFADQKAAEKHGDNLRQFLAPGEVWPGWAGPIVAPPSGFTPPAAPPIPVPALPPGEKPPGWPPGWPWPPDTGQPKPPPPAMPPGGKTPQPPTVADPCAHQWDGADLDAHMPPNERMMAAGFLNNDAATAGAFRLAAQSWAIQGYPRCAGAAVAMAACRDGAKPPGPGATPPDPALPPAAADWPFKLRWADTPYLLSAWYTGDGGRWQEILAVNPGMKAKTVKRMMTADGKRPCPTSTPENPDPGAFTCKEVSSTAVDGWGGGRRINLPAAWPVGTKDVPTAGTTRSSGRKYRSEDMA